MDVLLNSRFTWANFLTIALVLLAIYFVMRFLEQLIRWSFFSQGFKANWKRFWRRVWLVYELVALVILAGVFVFINPVFHGLFLLLFLIGGFSYIKSYVSGRILLFDKDIVEGIELKTNNLRGIIAKLGRSRLHLQTEEGMCHLNYYQLIENDYTLIPGKKISRFCYLQLIPEEEISNLEHLKLRLMDLFVTTPYIDRNHKLELLIEEGKAAVNAKILLKEDNYLPELIALIKEWGISCKILH